MFRNQSRRRFRALMSSGSLFPVKMEDIVGEIVPPEDLKKFEKVYNDQCLRGPPSVKAQFEYAWCLVRSRYSNDLRKGASLLTDLYQKAPDDVAKRDYLFYLSVAHTRLKEYDRALKYAEAILQVEPKNHQAQQLRDLIKKKMQKEGIMGMAIVGGVAAVAIGGLVGLGMALSKK